MQVPDYLTDQSEDYIQARGFTFRDFSAEQVLGELAMRSLRVKLHGVERDRLQSKGFKTITDNVPYLTYQQGMK